MIIKPRILIISSRADFGGGPEHIYRLTKHLVNDFDFYFAVPDDFPYYKRYLDLVEQNHIIKIPHRKFAINTLLKLVSFVKSNRINIIHSHGKGAGIYSRLLRLFLKVKVIHTFHGIHVGNYNRIKRFFYLTIERILSLTTTKFINVSDGENYLTRKYKITSPHKTIVIENGVEIPNEILNENQFNQNPRIVITFTRFDYAKNTELLIPILKQLKKHNRLDDFKFLVYGSGPNQEKINDLLIENNLSNYVHFCGTTLGTTKLLLNSFCYISTSRWEGLPLGILEAFACGLPVIATEVVGNYNVIDDGINGMLYKLEVPSQAADKLVELSEDKELWLNISKRSRLKAESDYNIRKMTDKTAQLYLNIINSN
jgi:glycosyltransferase involved in cell wall biosynthesis